MNGEASVAESMIRGSEARKVSELATVPEAEIEVLNGRELQCFEPVRQALFLQALKRTPIVGRACREAGVSVATAYRLRKRSRAFAQAWDESLGAAVDEIEQRAIDRAMDDSDRLMVKVLEAKRPEEYSPKVDMGAAARVQIVVDLVPGGFTPTVEAEDVEVLEEDGEVKEPGSG